MDWLTLLGMLALASRLKRLTERLYRDGEKVYADQNLDFLPRWFPVFAQLHQNRGKAMSITQIASSIGITHPAVIKLTREMQARGLINSLSDAKDGRKRLVRISKKGQRLYSELEPIWEAFVLATRELFEEIDIDLIAVIDQVEQALSQRSMAERITEYIKRRQATSVEIVDFQPAMAEQFKALNLQWLQEQFQVEPADKSILDHPQAEVIDRGGFILYARLADRIVGTLALIKLDDDQYELAKMTVAPEARGKQVGKKLLHSAINRARSVGARRLVLHTHPRHQVAVQLYRKSGFETKSVPLPRDHSVSRAAGGFSMILTLEGE